MVGSWYSTPTTIIRSTVECSGLFMAQTTTNPSHCSLPFLLRDRLHRFSGLYTDTSELIRFFLLFLVFFCFPLFSCWSRAVDKADLCQSFWAHVKITARVVSYRKNWTDTIRYEMLLACAQKLTQVSSVYSCSLNQFLLCTSTYTRAHSSL